MSNSIRNKFLAIRYFNEIMSGCNLASLYELIGHDFVLNVPAHQAPYRGPDGLKDLVMMMHACFPDFYVRPIEMIAMENTVVTLWICGGTHLGSAIKTEFGSIPPSGRKFAIEGISWQCFEAGKLIETYSNEDIYGMFTQLGVIKNDSNTLTVQENQDVVYLFYEKLMTMGDTEIAEEILTSDATLTFPGECETLKGLEQIKGWVTQFHTAFPDVRFVVDRTVMEFDKVATRFYMSGTHCGEYKGIDPTNIHIKEFGESFFVFDGEKIKSIHQIINHMGLLNQLQASMVKSDMIVVMG